MKAFFITIFFAMALCGCSENDATISKGEVLTVAPNTEYAFGKGIYLKTRQIADTRRPMGTRMIWQGDAKLKLQLYTGRRTVDTVLSTTFPNEVVIDGIRLKINSVYPYPELNKPRSQSDYSIQLVMERED